MRRKVRQSSDSLDLLLDTMCNAFGGIVLIAILVALLIEKPGQEASDSSVSSKEALERSRKARKLKRLESELQQLQSHYDQNREIIELIHERERLAETLASRQEAAALSTVELNERLDQALREKSSLLEEVSRVRRDVASLEARIEENREQSAGLDADMRDLVSNRMKKIRPAELRDAGGFQINLIVRYGEIFPVRFLQFTNDGEVQGIMANEDSVQWAGAIAQPIPGHGWTLESDRGTLQALVGGISNYNRRHSARPSQRMHVSLFVYGDSFEVIAPLRALIEDAGNIASGWEPWPEDVPLAFSANGEKGQVE